MSFRAEMIILSFFFSSRRRHTRSDRDWSSDVCSSDLSSGALRGSGEKGLTPMEPIIEDRVIPPGEVWARVVASGQVLRIVDLEGKQAVDFLCYHAANPEERYNAADTMKYAGTIFLTRGHGIYADMGRRLFTVVEDTCGRHDTIGGGCTGRRKERPHRGKGTPTHPPRLLPAPPRLRAPARVMAPSVRRRTERRST